MSQIPFSHVPALGARSRPDLPQGSSEHSFWRGNIENFTGLTQVPTGLAGPFILKGQDAKGAFCVPLATTEGALVASYHRGARVTREAGGITTFCSGEQVQRSPVFCFQNLLEVAQMLAWLEGKMEVLREITKGQTQHGSLKRIEPLVEGNHLILTLHFQTGDAAGQNMVTFCTDAICRFLLENGPVSPQTWYIESNFSGDKKATARSLQGVRGKRVSAECTIPAPVVAKVLKSSPEHIAAYWQSSTMAVVQSGAIGAMGHAANGLTALFMATGQDVACVAEAAIGMTRFQVNPQGDLYAAVTLPNLIVGTVGGGTGLPTQRACLEYMGCYGAGKARKFAEICAAVVLAGELSIAAALAEGHFARAHRRLGRK